MVCEVLRGAAQADKTWIREAFEGQIHLSQEGSDWLDVGQLLGELQRKGLQPPILDVLISVIAKRNAAGLWHFGDRHFGPIGQLLELELVDLKAPVTPP